MSDIDPVAGKATNFTKHTFDGLKFMSLCQCGHLYLQFFTQFQLEQAETEFGEVYLHRIAFLNRTGRKFSFFDFRLNQFKFW